MVASRTKPAVWLLLLPLLTGCQSLFSGGELIPAKVTDRMEIAKAQTIIDNAPFIFTAEGKRPVKIYTVAFDGTLNDEANVPAEDRRTIVAHIHREAGTDAYYPGAGMQGKEPDKVDATTNASGPGVAAKARQQLFARVQTWYQQNPDTDVRVFVTGFSRGATTARRFINSVTEAWRASFHTPPPHFYAVLYDTVATFQQTSEQDKHYLTIPASVDYLVHFVAMDEARGLYAPTIDQDPTPLPLISKMQTQRINTIILPGAHSDIGASYQSGIGDIYLTLTEQLLYNMGLAKTHRWISHQDPLLAGTNDSRGHLDKFIGAQDPRCMVERPFHYAPAVALTPSEQQDIARRLDTMLQANAERGSNTFTEGRITDTASLYLKRQPQGLVFASASGNIDPLSVKIDNKGHSAEISFNLNVVDGQGQRVIRQRLSIKPHLLKRIRPQGSEIALSGFVSQGKNQLAIWLDNQLAELDGRPACQ